jgi:ABC-2 type transport system permease protein
MIIPLMLVFIGQLAGLFFINRQLIILAALFLIIVDAIMVYLSTRVFQREVILTRWK